MITKKHPDNNVFIFSPPIGDIPIFSQNGNFKGWRDKARRGALRKDSLRAQKNKEAEREYLSTLNKIAGPYRAGYASGQKRKDSAEKIREHVLNHAKALTQAKVKPHLLAGRITAILELEGIKRSEHTVRNILKEAKSIKNNEA